MAEGDQPQKKRQKVDNEVFKTFHIKYQAEDMSTLRNAYLKLFQKDCAFKCYSIKASNGNSAVPFKKAFVDLEEHIEEIYPIADMFETGLTALYSFLKSTEIPEDCNIRQILAALLTYLLDKDMMAPLDSVKEYCGNEQDVTLLVLNHLLLPLTPTTRCIVDDHSNWKFYCPDKCKYHPIPIESSDTSIGNTAVWHGRIDAIIGKPRRDAASALALIRDEDESDSPGFRSFAEVKTSFIDADSPMFQIVSQAIVFSFLQGNLHPELEISMIPTIGVSATELIVYFYDHVNDVLLQSVKSLDFEVAGLSRIQAILVAWLVVNYKYLSSGSGDALSTTPKANFFQACKEKLPVYRKNIRHGGVGRSQTNKSSVFKYDDSIVKLKSGLEKIKSFAE